MPTLLVHVRFHDDRYHGSGDWPPSPARVFQALVAGAARGARLPSRFVSAFQWLEILDAPAIAAPAAYAGQAVQNFVPNNDLDTVGGDPSRIDKIRAGKIMRPQIVDAEIPLLYAWTFSSNADAERHAHAICEIANDLYQLGRGVDMAWAHGDVVDDTEANARLRNHGGTVWHPRTSGDGLALSCPRPGSLESLTRRYEAMGRRFTRVESGRKLVELFSKPPEPEFRPVPYGSPPALLLFDIRNSDGFAPRPPERVVALTEHVRDLAVEHLKRSSWRHDDAKREALIERIFVGRDANDADKARRIRITPLPSIGHAHADRCIRRILVTVPAECPIRPGDIAWAFSGLPLDVDRETGEVPDDGAELVPADDRTMLAHYGIDDAAARVWRTVTPVALSALAGRGRSSSHRTRPRQDGGERLRENAAIAESVRQALRHAGIDAPVQAITVQREPFEANGQRAEAFATERRFTRARLTHVEITFAHPRTGPLLIGDGRYLGLGLMRPVQQVNGVLAFAITDGLAQEPEPLGVARALHRAVMARVQETIGGREKLPAFFSGHAPDGAPARSGRHEHLAFVFDAPRNRVLIVAPNVLERRDASRSEREHLRTLETALEDLRELRAGAAGKLALSPRVVDLADDPVFAPSPTWESLTPYRVTRHAKLADARAALEADLLAECNGAGLPKARITVLRTFAQPARGLFGMARLEFHSAVDGPILLGRDRHFGGGLFVAAD